MKAPYNRDATSSVGRESPQPATNPPSPCRGGSVTLPYHIILHYLCPEGIPQLSIVNCQLSIDQCFPWLKPRPQTSVTWLMIIKQSGSISLARDSIRGSSWLDTMLRITSVCRCR